VTRSSPAPSRSTTGNIPLLTTLISLPFGGDSPFQAEVWFVNLISKLDNKWGTMRPIQLEDPKYGLVVPVRAFGQFGFRIAEPRRFLEAITGTAKVFTAEQIVEYFKGRGVAGGERELGRAFVWRRFPCWRPRCIWTRWRSIAGRRSRRSSRASGWNW
jgi:hypothetical protein